MDQHGASIALREGSTRPGGAGSRKIRRWIMGCSGLLVIVGILLVGAAFLLDWFPTLWISGPTSTLTINSPVCGTWQTMAVPSMGPLTGLGIGGVAAFAPDDVWAIGVSGAFMADDETMMLHWDGTRWRRESSPSPKVEKLQIGGATAAAPRDAWAVGSGVYPLQSLIEHWDGTAWRMVAHPAPPQAMLQAVAARSSDDAWAVGESGSGSNGQTLTLHWDGANWTLVSSPNIGSGENELYGVATLAVDDVWAVGSAGNQTLTLHWDGASWNVVPSPNPCAGGNSLLGVGAANHNDVWAVGSCDQGDEYARYPLIMHWDGRSWTLVPSANNAQNRMLGGIAVISSADIWAVGSSGINSDKQTAVEHWDGKVWRDVPHPSPYQPRDQGAFSQVVAPSATDIWAVGTLDGRPDALIAHFVASPCSAPPPQGSPVP